MTSRPAWFQPTRPRGARPVISFVRARNSTGFQPTRPRGARRHPGGQARCPLTRFNPRAHAGRDIVLGAASVTDAEFQPTRPRGARLLVPCYALVAIHCFNPRAHAGRDLDGLAHGLRFALFQPTRPRGARRGAPSGWMPPARFNPRAHAGRDPWRTACCVPAQVVSTHAPTRGATVLVEGRVLHSVVSTHAPTRGATPSPSPLRPRRPCFNPRAHAGRDAAVGAGFAVAVAFQPTRPRGARQLARGNAGPQHIVSTHAPTRGATVRPFRRCRRSTTFQPTRPRGARRRIGRIACPSLRGFNPRAHAGRDTLDGLAQVAVAAVSTHAPTRGATSAVMPSSARRARFQPTRPRGARLRALRGESCRRCFNPRAHAGRDGRGRA